MANKDSENQRLTFRDPGSIRPEGERPWESPWPPLMTAAMLAARAKKNGGNQGGGQQQ